MSEPQGIYELPETVVLFYTFGYTNTFSMRRVLSIRCSTEGPPVLGYTDDLPG